MCIQFGVQITNVICDVIILQQVQAVHGDVYYIIVLVHSWRVTRQIARQPKKARESVAFSATNTIWGI